MGVANLSGHVLATPQRKGQYTNEHCDNGRIDEYTVETSIVVINNQGPRLYIIIYTCIMLLVYMYMKLTCIQGKRYTFCIYDANPPVFDDNRQIMRSSNQLRPYT